jgi:hypothetical protein
MGRAGRDTQLKMSVVVLQYERGGRGETEAWRGRERD